MKKLFAIVVVVFLCESLAAQTNARMSVAEQVPPKEADTKAKADKLYGKTQTGQQKELIFRQSVLDETNKTGQAEKADTVSTTEKLKLIDNKLKRNLTGQPK